MIRANGILPGVMWFCLNSNSPLSCECLACWKGLWEKIAYFSQFEECVWLLQEFLRLGWTWFLAGFISYPLFVIKVIMDSVNSKSAHLAWPIKTGWRVHLDITSVERAKSTCPTSQRYELNTEGATFWSINSSILYSDNYIAYVTFSKDPYPINLNLGVFFSFIFFPNHKQS